MKQKISVAIFSLTLLMTVTIVHAGDKNKIGSGQDSSSRPASPSLDESFIAVDNSQEIADLKQQINSMNAAHKEEIGKLTQGHKQAVDDAFEKGKTTGIYSERPLFIAQILTSHDFSQQKAYEILKNTAEIMAQPIQPERSLDSLSGSSSSSSSSVSASKTPTQHRRRLSEASLANVNATISSLLELVEANKEKSVASSKSQAKDSDDSKGSLATTQSAALTWYESAHSSVKQALGSGIGSRQQKKQVDNK